MLSLQKRGASNAVRKYLLHKNAFKKFCESCPVNEKSEAEERWITVSCSQPKCIYTVYEEIWEAMKNER